MTDIVDWQSDVDRIAFELMKALRDEGLKGDAFAARIRELKDELIEREAALKHYIQQR